MTILHGVVTGRCYGPEIAVFAHLDGAAVDDPLEAKDALTACYLLQ